MPFSKTKTRCTVKTKYDILIRAGNFFIQRKSVLVHGFFMNVVTGSLFFLELYVQTGNISVFACVFCVWNIGGDRYRWHGTGRRSHSGNFFIPKHPRSAICCWFPRRNRKAQRNSSQGINDYCLLMFTFGGC